MTFGEYVRHCRLGDGLQLTAVARKVGISKQMLSQMERNIKPPLLPKWWHKLDLAVPSSAFDALKRRYMVPCVHCAGAGKVMPNVVYSA